MLELVGVGSGPFEKRSSFRFCLRLLAPRPIFPNTGFQRDEHTIFRLLRGLYGLDLVELILRDNRDILADNNSIHGLN